MQEDAISREALVDDFIKWREKLEYTVGEDYSGVHLLNVAIQKIWDKPSVTPSRQIIEDIKNDIRHTVDKESKIDEKWARGLNYALCIIEKHWNCGAEMESE